MDWFLLSCCIGYSSLTLPSRQSVGCEINQQTTHRALTGKPSFGNTLEMLHSLVAFSEWLHLLLFSPSGNLPGHWKCICYDKCRNWEIFFLRLLETVSLLQCCSTKQHWQIYFLLHVKCPAQYRSLSLFFPETLICYVLIFKTVISVYCWPIYGFITQIVLKVYWIATDQTTPTLSWQVYVILSSYMTLRIIHIVPFNV